MKQPPENPTTQDRATPPRIIDWKQLFGEEREVWVEYAGVRYRLRITRRGRLVLTK